MLIINIKRENLEEAILGNHDLYNELSLIADKLRVIYTALGWTHMTKEFNDSDETVEYLTQHVLEALNTVEEGQEEPPTDTTWGTAGLLLNGYWDEEGMLNLDYSFSLI